MNETSERQAIVLAPGEGRKYSMGPMQAIFKADGNETAKRYTISKWWLVPYSEGPGSHSHPEEDTFFVIKGTMSFLLEDEWADAPAGSFVLVPGGETHNFENRSDERSGMLNFGAPGDFEKSMPAIVEWFKEYPLGRA